MDHEPVLVRIDIRGAAMRHHEMQTVRGYCAVHQMVRRARALGTRLAVRIVQRAHSVFLEPRGPLVGLDGRTGLLAPRRFGQGCVRWGLGSDPSQRAESTGAHRTGKDHTAPEQCTTIQQAVAGNGLQRRGLGPAATMIRNAHISPCLPPLRACYSSNAIFTFRLPVGFPRGARINMRPLGIGWQRSSSPGNPGIYCRSAATSAAWNWPGASPRLPSSSDALTLRREPAMPEATPLRSRSAPPPRCRAWARPAGASNASA